MNGRRSPLMGKKRNNLQSPRPYSMFVGSQYLKVSDSYSISSNSSGNRSSYCEHTSTPSPKSGKLKRNSSAECSTNCTGAFDSLVCSLHAVDVNANNTTIDLVNSPPYSSSSKKKSNSPQKRMMPPAGPSARTWIVPKQVKKLPIGGVVFGTHMGRSGTCYVSVVTSKDERVLQMYDRAGMLVKSFQTRATKAGKPFEPYQMCETKDGHIAVACGSSVTVWSKEGKLITEHGKNMFKCAKSIAARSTGEIIVTDTDNNAVKIISSNGQLISRLQGDFYCPVGVSVDSDDNIIVVDWKDRIWIFDEENTLVRTFGTKGGADGEVDLPYGVSVDSENNLVLADMWNNRISVFTREGQFLRHLIPDPSQSAVRLPCSVSVSLGEHPDDYRMSATTFSGTAVYLFTY